MSSNNDPAPDDDPALRETLKRCSPATYYAACKYRAHHHPDDLRALVLGVIERFVERERRVKLSGTRPMVDGLALSQDLGLDSLTMMEIVMVAEEVLGVSISNEELTRLRTIGDVQAFIASKIESPRRPDRSKTQPVEPWNGVVLGEQVRQIEAASSRRVHGLAE